MKDDNSTSWEWMEQDVDRRARGHYGMALGWLKRGRVLSALNGFHKAIEIDQNFVDPYLEIGSLYLQLRRWKDLQEHCERGLRRFDSISEFHKLLITALEAIDSLDAAYQHYDLRRVDSRVMEIDSAEVLCCVTARNESARLPYFLDYYRELGVDRFFFIDNDSTDDSVAYLLQQDDVHLWRSSLPFMDANYGSSWFELLLRRHGVGHWCLTVDTDEFLVYQGAPEKNIKFLCRELEEDGKEALTGQLLDMYSDGPVRDAHYQSGQDPLEVCSYFDAKSYHRSYEMAGQYRNQRILFGGPRQRLFPAEHDYLLSKVGLLKYHPRVILNGGQHLTNIPAENLAHNQMVLLHFKFFSSFINYAASEAQREVHAMGGEQYKCYNKGIEKDQSLSLYDPQLSVQYQGADQLEQLGIIDPSPEQTRKQDFPAIEPLHNEVANEPFWSVMITVYQRSENIARVLQSVLQQVTESMQIEVVCDGGDSDRQQQVEQEVRRVGGERVGFHACEEHLGHPQIFNRAIDRAHGKWVHILHDDDWAEPGLYTVLAQEIARAPDAGAAFTQHRIVEYSGDNEKPWISWLESEQAGVLSDWLERISMDCRVQFSAMTVKREVYQHLGGFCPQALSTLDWEMWVRIAAHYPVIFVPQVLVGIGRDASAESSRLIRTGEQVLHGLAAIEISEDYLPADQAERLTRKAREQRAIYALDLARRYLDADDREAGLANLRAAVRCSDSPRVQRVMRQVLLGRDDEFVA